MIVMMIASTPSLKASIRVLVMMTGSCPQSIRSRSRSLRNPNRDGRHVVGERPGAPKRPGGLEDAIDDCLRRLGMEPLDCLQDAGAAEFLAVEIVCLRHAVRTEHVNVSTNQIES